MRWRNTHFGRANKCWGMKGMQKRVFGQRVKRVRGWERKPGRNARDSVAGVGGAGGIEFSHEIIACVYLFVKTNRKYKKDSWIEKWVPWLRKGKNPHPCVNQGRESAAPESQNRIRSQPPALEELERCLG